MKLIISLSVSLLLSTFYSSAQKVSAPDAALADTYKKKYKDDKFIALQSEAIIQFDQVKDKVEGDRVGVKLTNTETIMALRDNTGFSDAIFFDNESAITSSHAKYPKRGTAYFSDGTSDYQSDGIFYSDAKIYKYHLPFNTRGEQIIFDYSQYYNDVKYFTRVFFHQDYPVKERKFVFEVPDWLELELKEFNFEGFSVKKDVINDPSKKQKKYVYTISDMAAMKRESMSPNISKFYPHILILAKSMTDKSGKKTKLFASVNDLYTWYESLTKAVKNDPKEIKPLVDKIIAGKKTDNEKIETLFYWVQTNIRYVAFEQGIMGFKPYPAQEVYKNKFGDCKGKANLLKEMLKAAGYDARLTWIGTVDIPYDYTIPSIAVDNHMICTVILNDKKYFLDGTEDYIAFGDYAHRIQGRPVLIENGDKYFIDTVPSFTKERNKQTEEISLTIEGDIIKGKYGCVTDGEEKTSLLRNYAKVRTDIKEDALASFLSSGDKNVRISNVNTSDMENRTGPLKINYNFDLENYITKVGNELYLSLDKKKEFSSWTIDSTRISDIEFSYRILHVAHTELTLPAGYKVDHLPENVLLSNPDFSFKLSMKHTGNKIVYDKTISVDNAIIRKKDFDTWREYNKKVNEFYNDQVILVKQ